MKKKYTSWKDYAMAALPILSLLMFFFCWLYLAAPETSRVPSPIDVWNRFLIVLEIPISRVPLTDHILASIQRVLIGLGVAILLGIINGMLMALLPTFRAIFMPLFNMLRMVPPIAWIPLFTIWFGVGEFPKLALIVYGCIVQVSITTYTGISMVPDMFNSVGHIFHARKLYQLLDITMPSAVPAIIAGIKAALSTAWMILLSAEMISAKQGLGFLITRGSDSNDIALSMISMVIIGVLGCTMSVLLTYLERRLCPWKAEIN